MLNFFLLAANLGHPVRIGRDWLILVHDSISPDLEQG